MLAKTAKQLLSRFLEFTETEVLGAFGSLARAQKHSEYVYIPGTRKDRILLVAHADTVNNSTYSPKIHWMGDVCTLETFWRKPRTKKVYDSAQRISGYLDYSHSYNHSSLGADDRAGCTMLWALQQMGHSLLITTGEEGGCKGARVAARELKDELPLHAYALEIDRRGDRQAVFYDISTEIFEHHMLELLSKHDPEGVEWLQEMGSFTDVRAICPEAGICGVNVSAGYYNEHSEGEHLYLEAWLHTHGTLLAMLKEEQKAFTLPKKAVIVSRPSETKEGWVWCYIHGGWDEHCPVSIHTSCARYKKENAANAGNPTAGKGSNESPFKLQVFRSGGVKPGEGIVTLRAIGVGGKQGALSRISKRQCKKFGKYLVGMAAKGAINNAEATSLLQQAIELRDGLRTLVTQEQREEHAAGGTDAFKALPEGTLVRGMLESGKKASKPNKDVYNRGGEYVPIASKEGAGRCWHHCRGCKRLWYHERREAAEDRPNFFCYCPVCSPDVVPRLIAPANYHIATWGYESYAMPAPQAAIETARSVPDPGIGMRQPSLNEPTICQHYCSQCSAPWRHLRQAVSRVGVICKVGAYDHDCPLHNVEAAKVVIFYENGLKLKGGWTQTLHTPPAEDKPATGNGSHGAAPSESRDQLPLGGLGTSQVSSPGGGGVTT